MLIVSYEDLWQDLGQAIDRIGSFVGTTSPSHRKAEILSRCSFEFMRANEHKLNPVPGRNYIPGSEDGHFIRRGRCGDARPHVSAKALAAYQEQCRRHLGSLMPEYHGLPG